LTGNLLRVACHYRNNMSVIMTIIQYENDRCRKGAMEQPGRTDGLQNQPDGFIDMKKQSFEQLSAQ